MGGAHLAAVLVVLEAGEVVHEPVQLLKALVLLFRLESHEETAVSQQSHGALLRGRRTRRRSFS